MSRNKYSVWRALIDLHFITPSGLWKWVECLLREGVTLMALFRFSAHFYRKRCAILSDGMSFSYSELYGKACGMASLLHGHYALCPGQRVGLLCRNHITAVLLLPALSRLGVKTYLLNTDIGAEKASVLFRNSSCKYNYLIVDEELRERCLPQSVPYPIITTEQLLEQLKRPELYAKGSLPRVCRGPELSVQTGGSGGHHKEAARRPSATHLLPPLLALLRQIGIHQYRSTYIALPFYHGFGLATLITSLVMGKEVLIMRYFDAKQALQSISDHHIEVVPLVPVMLSRMLQLPQAEDKLCSVRCVISGGDRLDHKLIVQTHELLGPVLYNLFGTSEAGFFLLATPFDLEHCQETTLGRPIKGVHCRVSPPNKQSVGELWVRSRWAMQGRRNRWQSTGDLVYRNADGLFFHRGRVDQMVVCGGENVYPEQVEQTIVQHPDVVTARVCAVPHETFGFVLTADVEKTENSSLTEDTLREWLRPRLARAEMPHQITFRSITLLNTGKRMLFREEL